MALATCKSERVFYKAMLARRLSFAQPPRVHPHRCVYSYALGICMQRCVDVYERAFEDILTSVTVSGSIEAVTVDSDVATKSTEID